MKKAVVLSILFVVVLLAVAVIAEAQQAKKVPRIGYLSSFDPVTDSARTETIRLALRELGYIEGQSIAIEYRYAEGKVDRQPELAVEVVRLRVDIIVVAVGAGPIRVVKNATKTIPIVMAGLPADPVELGLVESLAVQAATSPVLLSFSESEAGSGWSCSKKPFPNLILSRFSMIQPIREAHGRRCPGVTLDTPAVN
jgi:putative ABC transport system substrate-binding protein